MHRPPRYIVIYKFYFPPNGELVKMETVNIVLFLFIGNGTVINLPEMFEEIKNKEENGMTNVLDRLLISDRAHLVFNLHQVGNKMSYLS